MPHRRVIAIWGACIAVAALAVYANNLGNEFVWDDPIFIRDNTLIRDLNNIPTFFAKPWTYAGKTPGPYKRLGAIAWRPIALTSYALDYALWGQNPLGYHLANNLIYAAVCVLVLLVLLRLGLSHWAAGLATLLFVVHPVHTEAVDVITYRTTLLAALFFLLGVLSHLHGRLGHPRRRWLFLRVLTPICYALACLSKESGTTLIAVVVACDLALARDLPWRQRLVDYLPLALVGISYVLVRRQIVEPTHFHFFMGEPAWVIALTQFKVLRLDATLLLSPFPLCPFYDWTIFPPVTSPWEVEIWIGVAVALGLLAAVVVGLIRRGPWLLASAWLLITLTPYLQLVPMFDVAGERFLFIPSVALSIAVGLGLDLLWRRGSPFLNRAVVAILALVLCAFTAMTVVRNQQWSTTQRMHEVTVRYFPYGFASTWELGRIHLQAGRLERALYYYRRAAKILPDMAKVRRQLKRVEQLHRRRSQPPTK